MTCEHCQQQMLPFLYALLDDPERQELARHVETCANCQEALKSAKEQQMQLAAAVKQPQSDVVFKAPAKTAATPASLAPTVAGQRPRGRGFTFSRWGIAASVLGVLIAGASVVGAAIWSDQANSLEQHRHRLAMARDDHKNARDLLDGKKTAALKEIKGIQEQINSHFGDWRSAESQTRKDLQEKGAQLRVIGPQNPNAGGKNIYEVEMPQDSMFLNQNLGQQQANIAQKQAKDLPGMPPVQARIFDQRNQQKLTDWQQLKPTLNNRQNFNLPPDLPQPGQDLAIEFQAQTDTGAIVTFRDNLKFTSPEYVTHLATDRSLYRPGDTVRFRSLTLERFSLQLPQQALHLRYRITGPNDVELYNKEFASRVVAGKNNDAVKGLDGAPLLGVGVGEFALPADVSSGRYTLSVSEVNERFPEEKRTFTVKRWHAPRFETDVTFDRSSYGAGGKVKMAVRVKPFQGPAANIKNEIKVVANVTVDDLDVAFANRSRLVDNEGRVDFEFTLPERIQRGEGVVTIQCKDAVSYEMIERSLPIVGGDLDIEFFPEGGDLIAGVPNRVYFQARTKANRPADIAGRIVDDAGLEVARLQTLSDANEPGINQGLGSFTLTPKLNRRYSLRLDAPVGIERAFPLPNAKISGVALHITQEVVDNEIDVTLHNAKESRTLLIAAYCRGRWIGHKDNVEVKANASTQINWKLPLDVAGVYRITVFERKGRGDETTFHPLAERLIYRKNAEHVDVTVTSDRGSYQPGQTVRLNLQARNEKKQFVPTLALVAVVDQSVLKAAVEKTARSLPTHFLLTTEVRASEDIEHADVMLGVHPKAAQSLDLLLGCQGWRRFAEQDPEMFQRKQQSAKAPSFLANSVTVPQFLDNEQKQIERLDQNYVTKAVDLQKKLGVKENADVRPPDLLVEIEQTRRAVGRALQEIVSAEIRLLETETFFIQIGRAAALLSAIFVGLYLCSVGVRQLSADESPRVWFALSFGLLALLFFGSIIGGLALKGERIFDLNGFRVILRNITMPQGAPDIAKDANVVLPPPLVREAELLVGDTQPVKDAAKGVAPLVNRPRPVKAIEKENPRNEVNHQDAPLAMDQLLRQRGQYHAILLKEMGRRVVLPAVNEPCVVREYAHRRQPAKDDVRRDFTETIYWQPVLVMPDGRADVSFDLSDSITQFEVLVLSNTADGRFGVNRTLLTSKLPPKAP